ncbi:MAG: hypothetical protein ACOC2F_00450 [Bacteroidota bacterium]
MKRTKINLQRSQYEQLIYESFKSSGYLVLNKSLIQTFGLIKSCIISNLLDKHQYFCEKHPKHEGWFFLTHEQQKEQLGLSEYTLVKNKKELIQDGIIEVKRQGVPSKEWYKINFTRLYDTVAGLAPPKSPGLDPPKSPGLYKEPIYKEPKDKEIVSKDTDAPAGHSHDNDIISIINYWNTLPNVVKHTQPNTKVYQNCYQYIHDLLSGLPLLHKKDQTPTRPLLNFISKFHINPKLVQKQWTVDEIKQMLSTIQENDPVSRSLQSVFWNNQSAASKVFSYFLFEADKGHVGAKYMSIAEKLANAIDPDLPSDKLYIWAKEFEKLVEGEGKDAGEVKALVLWYGAHVHEKYTPQAADAVEFVDKYNKIKRAKMRGEQTEDSSASMTYDDRPLTRQEIERKVLGDTVDDTRPKIPEHKKCPYGHKFGIDWDYTDDCFECEMEQECRKYN